MKRGRNKECRGSSSFFSSGLIRLLGERVLAATERLMGMILTTVAVEMFLSALRTIYHP